ncbi:hypothetical protein J6590_099645 [Homalodisca vitripennis]|nr:hypothetical protein J6590_099645 [Homalodisca vitripennis]
MASDTDQAFSNEIKECNDFRKRQKLARLSGKSYVTQNKRKQIPEKKLPTEESIEHKFLVPGHSFSAADRDFAVIEKKAKVSKMQTVQDVEQVIRTARTSRPFKVLSMDKFFNFEEAASKYINTKNIQISQLSCLKKFYALKKNISLKDIASTELTTLPEEVPLAENKKNDLRNMLGFIDDHNRDFYWQLCEGT